MRPLQSVPRSRGNGAIASATCLRQHSKVMEVFTVLITLTQCWTTEYLCMRDKPLLFVIDPHDITSKQTQTR